MSDGPAYVYASTIPAGDDRVPAYVAFCPAHVHLIAMPLSRGTAERVAASHNWVHHLTEPDADYGPIRSRVGPLDYFDMNSGEVRRVA